MSLSLPEKFSCIVWWYWSSLPFIFKVLCCSSVQIHYHVFNLLCHVGGQLRKPLTRPFHLTNRRQPLRLTSKKYRAGRCWPMALQQLHFSAVNNISPHKYIYNILPIYIHNWTVCVIFVIIHLCDHIILAWINFFLIMIAGKKDGNKSRKNINNRWSWTL